MVGLSFDIEEFDLPLERRGEISEESQISVSAEGALRVLRLLSDEGVKATFFCTVNFARRAPEVMNGIIAGGHETGSHGMYHSRFAEEDLAASRLELETLTSQRVIGFRMPRMMKTGERALAEAGYLYDSSLNPTFIPGRYMHLREMRTPHFRDGVLEIPTSVTPVVRFPLFWLSAHILGKKEYEWLAMRALKSCGLFTTYFHPWEFYDLKSLGRRCRIPGYIAHNSGERMLQRLKSLITKMKEEGEKFVTYTDIYNSYR